MLPISLVNKILLLILNLEGIKGKQNGSLIELHSINALSRFNFQPDIDFFASRINCLFPKYVLYRPDPEAFAIDAFSLQWSKLDFYAFPPFIVIPAVLSKIQREEALGVVLPDWPVQGWYPKALEILKQEPIYLKARRDLLRLPSHPEEVHPIWHKLNLLVCLLSGKV